MSRPFFVLELHCEGTARTEFWLNDQPVIVRGDGPGLGRYLAAQSNHLLVDGTNELTIVVEPGPTPSLALGTPGERRRRGPILGASDEGILGARASMKLVRYLEGMVVGDRRGAVLASLAWEAPDHGGDLSWPQAISTKVDLGPVAGGPWRWQSAPRLALDASLRAEAAALLERIGAALTKGDAAAFLALTAPRTADLARAYRRPLAEKEAELRRLVVEEAATPHGGATPLEPEAWDLRLVGDGRLLDCVRADGQAILRGPPKETPGLPGGLRSTYELQLARLDGRLQVVR